MKTTFLLPAFLLLYIIASAQNADSISVAKQVDSLIQISRAFTGQQEFDKALEVNAVADKIALEKLGYASAAYGSCCFNRGRVLHFMRDYAESEKWYLEAKSIREKLLGKNHPDYLKCLKNLGLLYYYTGDFDRAEMTYIESKTILQETLGKEHPDYAECLNGLAAVNMARSHFEAAEQYFLEGRAVREKVLGKEHPDYAGNLNNLGYLYRLMGQYEKSEQYFLEAKDIAEVLYGKENIDYANILNNIGLLNYNMGNYASAELLFLEAISIVERNLWKENPDYTDMVGNLGLIYYSMGNYEKAEKLYLEAKAIREKISGKEHPKYAAILNNLAILYYVMGNYAKSEPLYLEAIAIREKTLGKAHIDYATNLGNLAILYEAMGFFEKSEKIFLEVIEILDKLLGKEHPFYAMNVNNLGMGYFNSGKYEKSEPFLLQAMDILKKTLGGKHLDYLEGLNNLAGLYWALGKFDTAQVYLLEAIDTHKKILVKASGHLSEKELSVFIEQFGEGLDKCFSFPKKQQIFSATYYDNTLFYKGFLLNTVSQIGKLAIADPMNAEKYKLFKSYNRRLATEYANPIVERDSANIAILEEKANNLEKELVRTVAGYGDALRQVKWREVQSTLKPGEASVEFVRYRYFTPKATDSTMYAALILRHGDEQPNFIPLFEAKQIEALLHTSGEKKADYANTLYALKDRGVNPVGKPEKTLYELLWKPLEKELSNTKTIYYSPSGLLHRLNLAAVPINLDSVLGDRYQLVELGSTRQLVVPNQVKSSTNDAVLFGGIQYDSDISATAKTNTSTDSVSIVSRGELNFFNTDSALRVGTWGSLPFTDREVGNLEHILKAAGMPTQTHRGYTATEETFKTIGTGGKPSPRILHIATHGFFFPDPKNVGRV